MQLGQIATERSGVEQQFLVTSRVQSAIVGSKVLVGGIHHDLTDGITTGKRRSVEVTDGRRQIDRGQSSAALKNVGAKGNFLSIRFKGYFKDVFTTRERAIAYGGQGCGNHGLSQLDAAGISLGADALDVGAGSISQGVQPIVSCKGTITDHDIGAALESKGTQLSQALEGAGANGDNTIISSCCAIAQESNGSDIDATKECLGVDQQLVAPESFDHHFGDTGAVQEGGIADLVDIAGNNDLGQTGTVGKCHRTNFTDTQRNLIFTTDTHG